MENVSSVIADYDNDKELGVTHDLLISFDYEDGVLPQDIREIYDAQPEEDAQEEDADCELSDMDVGEEDVGEEDVGEEDVDDENMDGVAIDGDGAALPFCLHM